MKRDFNKWLETFRSSICDYKFMLILKKFTVKSIISKWS